MHSQEPAVKHVIHCATGDALDYLLKNTFTEAAGARKGFPKVAMIITDGKSQDPVESYAKKLRNMGVEIFVLGMWPKIASWTWSFMCVIGVSLSYFPLSCFYQWVMAQCCCYSVELFHFKQLELKFKHKNVPLE